MNSNALEMNRRKVENMKTVILADEFNRNEEQKTYVTKFKYGENVDEIFFRKVCFHEFYNCVMSEFEKKIKQIEQLQLVTDQEKCQIVLPNSNLEGIFEKFQTEISTFKSEFSSQLEKQLS